MGVTFDPIKREKALAERGLDFADAPFVFEGVTLEVEDIRKEYGDESSATACWQGGWSSSDTRRVARIVAYSA